MLILTLIPFGYAIHIIHLRKRTSFLMQIQHDFQVSWSFYFERTFGAVLQQNYCCFLQPAQYVNMLKRKEAK